MKQPVTTVRTLFVHNDWARDKLLAAAEPLGDDQLDQTFEMGLGSLRATLHHLWSAEQAWLDRWLKRDGSRQPDAAGMSIPVLRELFIATAAERKALFDREGAAGESCPMNAGDSRQLPLGDMALHVCNHGFQHRVQALSMLRRVGGEPPALDLLNWKMTDTPHPLTAYDLDTIREWFRYSDWAFEEVLALAEAAAADELDRAVDMGLGSLRGILLHIEDAESWWVENWSGAEAVAFEQLPRTTEMADLRRHHAETIERREGVFAIVTNDGLSEVVTAQPPGDRPPLHFILGDTMLQLPGHGTHHRAQVVNLLRHVGVEPPRLGYVKWLTTVGCD